MIRTISAAAALLLLCACGDGEAPGNTGATGSGVASAPMALATDPPISASDIDRIVEEERSSAQPANAASPAAGTPR